MPTYYEMIREAIWSQHDPQGTSAHTIRRFIIANYPNVSYHHHEFLTALKKGLKEGKFKKLRGSLYRLTFTEVTKRKKTKVDTKGRMVKRMMPIVIETPAVVGLPKSTKDVQLKNKSQLKGAKENIKKNIKKNTKKFNGEKKTHENIQNANKKKIVPKKVQKTDNIKEGNKKKQEKQPTASKKPEKRKRDANSNDETVKMTKKLKTIPEKKKAKVGITKVNKSKVGGIQTKKSDQTKTQNTNKQTTSKKAKLKNEKKVIATSAPPKLKSKNNKAKTPVSTQKVKTNKPLKDMTNKTAKDKKK